MRADRLTTDYVNHTVEIHTPSGSDAVGVLVGYAIKVVSRDADMWGRPLRWGTTVTLDILGLGCLHVDADTEITLVPSEYIQA